MRYLLCCEPNIYELPAGGLMTVNRYSILSLFKALRASVLMVNIL